MSRLKSLLALMIAFVAIVGVGSTAKVSALDVGDECPVDVKYLLGIPPWYKYLPGEGVNQIAPVSGGGYTETVVCQPVVKTLDDDGTGKPENIPINNILLIMAAILEMLTRIAGLAAFVYLIYGGFMYLTSNGNAENVSKAGSTLLNAAIGLGIAISATAFINFFAGKLAQ